jgi:hypothetical protein
MCTRLVLVLSLLVLASATERIKTTLPAKPKENARVIVAPCSPLMATQQRWSLPTYGKPAPLALLSVPGMQLHMEPIAQQAGHAGVVRTSAPNASVWGYNKRLSVLQLVTPGANSAEKCLRYLQSGQYSNVAVGDCATASWSSQVQGPVAGGGLSSSGMLTQGGQGGRPAPLASRLHKIPTHFLLNLHGI